MNSISKWSFLSLHQEGKYSFGASTVTINWKLLEIKVDQNSLIFQVGPSNGKKKKKFLGFGMSFLVKIMIKGEVITSNGVERKLRGTPTHHTFDFFAWLLECGPSLLSWRILCLAKQPVLVGCLLMLA